MDRSPQKEPEPAAPVPEPPGRYKTPPAVYADELHAAMLFDSAIVEYQHLHLDSRAADLRELLMHVAADVGQANAAFLEKDAKATIAFLLKACATAREAVSHYKELRTVVIETFDVPDEREDEDEEP